MPKFYQGSSVSRGAPTITHLLYADDLLLASRENTENARALVKCLNYFCDWSGQQINTDKSSILFSKNTKLAVKRSIKDIIGIKEMKDGSEYLGNSLIFRRNKAGNFGWWSQLLSKAKATLILSYFGLFLNNIKLILITITHI